MKIVCTRNRDLSNKDALIVMISPPEEHPGPKIVLSFNVGEEVDLKKVVKEKGLKFTADELGHTIMGDKRFKGLFKVVGAGAIADETVSAADTSDTTPTPKKKRNGTLIKKPSYDDKSLDTSTVDAG